MIDTILELFPAYGRSYTSQKSFKEDFKDRKDFNSEKGYCSIDDFFKTDLLTVYININNIIVYIVRFGKLQDWVKKKYYWQDDHIIGKDGCFYAYDETGSDTITDEPFHSIDEARKALLNYSIQLDGNFGGVNESS